MENFIEWTAIERKDTKMPDAIRELPCSFLMGLIKWTRKE